MTSILGVSAFYHDSAAALVIDGELIAASQEERFTRKKHEASFPERSIAYCLDVAGLTPEQLDYVGYYEKPLRKFERILETYLAFAPQGYRSFRLAMPIWLRQKLHVRRAFRHGVLSRYPRQVVFLDHHQSHAASAFLPSPFSEAAIITMDGVGEWSTSCLGIGRENHVELTRELRFPHSLGLFYSALTYHAGFRVNSGEYKLMGLAPYGEPIYRDRLLEHVVDLKEDGSFRLNMQYFNYCQGLTMTSDRFNRLVGGRPRAPESEVTQRETDLAASAQAVAEEVILRTARYAHRTTGMKHLVLAGGVALNCVANGRILRESPFERLWVQPAAGDAGGALGTAMFIWHQLLGQPRRSVSSDSQHGSLLGPEFTDQQIVEILRQHGAVFDTCESEVDLCERVARLIDQQMVVGWFQGRMEFGPRALGARSILADPRNPEMRAILNSKIKFRESFRPFAPIVLQEKADQYFAWDAKHESPYMSFVVGVRGSKADDAPGGGASRYTVGSTENQSPLPAVTHIDGTARLQTVCRTRFPRLYRLLTAFDRLTGCPVLINTSFNVRGEPIVCSPADAWRCFMMTEMDALAIGNHLLLKREQRRGLFEIDHAAYAASLAAD